MNYIVLFFMICVFFCNTLFAQTQITNRINWEYHPKWHSLNSDTIFYTYNNTNDSIAIYMFIQSTGIDYMLPIDKKGDFHFDITPDGHKMIFDAREDENHPVCLYSINLFDYSIQLIKSNAGYPCISPDGKRIAYTSNNKMYTSDIDGSNEQILSNISAYYEISDWSPDGSKIALTIEQNDNSDLWIINSDGTNLTRITTNPNRDYWPVWSPDGQKLAFTSVNSGNYDLWLVNVDGTNLNQLTTHPAVDNQPEWSKDGSKILFSSSRGGSKDIWVLDVNTSDINTLNENLEFNAFPNPANGQVFIEFYSCKSQDALISVYSESGTIVTKQKINVSADGKAVIKLNKGNSLSPGTYVISIELQNKMMSKKIVIN